MTTAMTAGAITALVYQNPSLAMRVFAGFVVYVALEYGFGTGIAPPQSLLTKARNLEFPYENTCEDARSLVWKAHNLQFPSDNTENKPISLRWQSHNLEAPVSNLGNDPKSLVWHTKDLQYADHDLNGKPISLHWKSRPTQAPPSKPVELLWGARDLEFHDVDERWKPVDLRHQVTSLQWKTRHLQQPIDPLRDPPTNLEWKAKNLEFPIENERWHSQNLRWKADSLIFKAHDLEPLAPIGFVPLAPQRTFTFLQSLNDAAYATIDTNPGWLVSVTQELGTYNFPEAFFDSSTNTYSTDPATLMGLVVIMNMQPYYSYYGEKLPFMFNDGFRSMYSFATKSWFTPAYSATLLAHLKSALGSISWFAQAPSSYLSDGALQLYQSL